MSSDTANKGQVGCVALIAAALAVIPLFAGYVVGGLAGGALGLSDAAVRVVAWAVGAVAWVVAIVWIMCLWRDRRDRLTHQRTAHAGYTRDDFIAELTARGLRPEAAGAAYDYLARRGPTRDWPVHPDDALHDIYQVDVAKDIVRLAHLELPCRQPERHERQTVPRPRTAGDLAGWVDRFYEPKHDG